MRVVIAGLLSVLAASVTFAEEARVRSYALPDHGQFQLRVPMSWKHEVRQSPNRLPPTIVFKPQTGAAFEIFLTPIWPARPDVPTATPERLRRQVEQAAERAKPKATESTIDVKELRGSAGVGYYFSATDRAPAPGEYKYLTQGLIRVGTLVTTFTLLTNDEATSTVADALAMIGSAGHATD